MTAPYTPDPIEVDPEPQPARRRPIPASVSLSILFLLSLITIAIAHSVGPQAKLQRERLRLLHSSDPAAIPMGCSIDLER